MGKQVQKRIQKKKQTKVSENVIELPLGNENENGIEIESKYLDASRSRIDGRSSTKNNVRIRDLDGQDVNSLPSPSTLTKVQSVSKQSKLPRIDERITGRNNLIQENGNNNELPKIYQKLSISASSPASARSSTTASPIDTLKYNFLSVNNTPTNTNGVYLTPSAKKRAARARKEARSQRCFGLRKRFVILILLIFMYLFVFTTTVLPTPPSEFIYSELMPNISAEIQSQLTRLQSIVMDTSERPGILARKDGIEKHFPVVLIPGIVSSSLELWEGEECARPYFRQRVWGSSMMFRSMLLDSRCWLRHMILHPETGFDPPGIKLRASLGLEAADYLMGVYWVWAKIIQNLADIGYDSNSMFLQSYDWRMGFPHLQVRDFYFSKLKTTIELAKLSNSNRKVVLIPHSMGGLLLHYFFNWIEKECETTTPDWVNEHIQAVVSIGGPYLGVAKAYSAIFSGEMKDTAELAPFLDYWRQRVVLSQNNVITLMRSIFSLPSMLPKGGNACWGDTDFAPDDISCKSYKSTSLDPEDSESHPTCEFSLCNADTSDPTSHGTFLQFTNYHFSTTETPHDDEGSYSNLNSLDLAMNFESDSSDEFSNSTNPYIFRFNEERSEENHYHHPPNTNGSASVSSLTLDEAYEFFRIHLSNYTKTMEKLYSFGARRRVEPNDTTTWANPLESPLPNAPNMTIYCLYGVGRPTERGYIYSRQEELTPLTNSSHWKINTSYTLDASISKGVKYTDGDGTVPLVSLGYMCADGWKQPHLNPSEIPVVIREYYEQNATLAIMRAATSTDHVDIIGNSDLIKDILHIVGVRKHIDKNQKEEEDRQSFRETTNQATENDDVLHPQSETVSQKGDEEMQRQEAREEGEKTEETDRRGRERANLRWMGEEMDDADEKEKDNIRACETSSADQRLKYTFVEVKPRIYSCIRQISEVITRRLRQKWSNEPN